MSKVFSKIMLAVFLLSAAPMQANIFALLKNNAGKIFAAAYTAASLAALYKIHEAIETRGIRPRQNIGRGLDQVGCDEKFICVASGLFLFGAFLAGKWNKSI